MPFALSFLALGLGGALLVAALGAGLPTFALPNVPLLFTLAATLVMPSATGLLLAFAFGLGADMLSDALLGQHAFTHLLVWALLRALAAQVELRRAGALFVLGALLTLVSAFGLWCISWFFLGDGPVARAELGRIGVHALVCGVCTPLVVNFAHGLGRVFSEHRAHRDLARRARRAAL